MATYNEGPGTDKNGNPRPSLPSQPNTNEGLDPTSTGTNRIFWNDRFVEPKQQHRFTIKIPIYTPNGPKKDSLLMAQAIKNKLSAPLTGNRKSNLEAMFKKLPTKLESNEKEQDIPIQIKGAFINAINDVALTAENAPTREATIDLIARRFDIQTADGDSPDADQIRDIFGIKNDLDRIFPDEKLGAALRKGKSLFNSNNFSTAKRYGTNDDIGLFMRVSEYVGYSFTPPGFNYTPGSVGKDTKGNDIRVEGMGSYGRGSATLTFVTTLRDDLHFSLNLLWALSTSASNSQARKSSVRLFDSFLAGELEENEKVVTIYEHYARQTKDKNGESINNINKYAVAGIHKIYNPIIESVTFGEFSYGGSELIKVTMNLTYGSPYDQSNFYSYQITEDRYGGGDDLNRGDVYAMTEGDYKPVNEYFMKINPADPIFGSVKNHLTEQRPNKYSPNSDLRDLTLQELKERKNQLLVETNNERSVTRKILEGGSKIDKNNLVTKGISEIIAEREAVEKRRQDALRENALGAGGESLADFRRRAAEARQDRRAQEMANQMHAEYTAIQQRQQQINDEQSLGAGASAVTSVVP